MFDPKPGSLDAFHKGLEEMHITECEEDGRDYEAEVFQRAEDSIAAKKAGWTPEKYHKLMTGAPATTITGRRSGKPAQARGYPSVWPYVALEWPGTLAFGIPLSNVKLMEDE